MSNRHSPPLTLPRVLRISFSLAGVPTRRCIASRCIAAISFCRPEEPAAPAASADLTPRGPPMLRTTNAVSAGHLGPGRRLTLVTLRRLIHCGRHDDDRRSAIRYRGRRQGQTQLQSGNDAVA
jgi:hypothetical protein